MEEAYDIGKFTLPASQHNFKKHKKHKKHKQHYIISEHLSLCDEGMDVVGLFEGVGESYKVAEYFGEHFIDTLNATLKDKKFLEKSISWRLKEALIQLNGVVIKKKFKGAAIGTVCLKTNDACFTLYVGPCMAVVASEQACTFAGEDHVPKEGSSEFKRIIDHKGIVVELVLYKSKVDKSVLATLVKYYEKNNPPKKVTQNNVEDRDLINSIPVEMFFVLHPKSKQSISSFLDDSSLISDVTCCYPYSRIIGRTPYASVGVQGEPEVVENTEKSIEYVLIASSNYWNYLTLKQTEQVIQDMGETSTSPNQICKALCDLARSKGCSSEVSVILLGLGEFKARVQRGDISDVDWGIYMVEDPKKD
jgi:serine/threonine protein phosphatase PrpC